jgi:hypothetical protein
MREDKTYIVLPLKGGRTKVGVKIRFLLQIQR